MFESSKEVIRSVKEKQIVKLSQKACDQFGQHVLSTSFGRHINEDIKKVLERDNEFLSFEKTFTDDLIKTRIKRKREEEAEAVLFRPHHVELPFHKVTKKGH
jgi:uncharacterized membrane-anchored protein YjiN (DUF445 family)